MSNSSTLRTLRRLCLALVVGAVAGCGSTSPVSETAHPAGFNIPWPGDGAPVRTASDDVVEFLGSEYALIGGAAAENGTAVDLTGGGDLPYAIYSLGGFLPPPEFTLLTVDAEMEEATPGDGTRLYVGLANYARNSWEWFAADSGGWSSGPLGSAYRSKKGIAAAAVVLDGPGTGTINSLAFTRTGDTTFRPPDPIYTDPSVGLIKISWDPVPVAEGYNIYRDEWPALPDPQKLNSEPVRKDYFDDRSVTPGVMYYYFVTAVSRGEESGPSSMLDVFAPEINLPEPTNLRLISSSPTTATVAWDWALGPPNAFQLYLEDHRDFNLVSPIQSPDVEGTITEYTFHRLDQTSVYRWRVCSQLGGKRGRMADDVLLVPRWTWGPIEDVGSGANRVAAIRAGTDLAAAYLNGPVVNFSRRHSGTWFEETVLDSEPFETFVDLAYSNSKFVVTGWAVNPGDMWVATGVPGSLVAERIHGDGSTAMGHHNSGLGGMATASATDFVVVHTYYEQHTTLIQTRPISGGDWTLTTLSTDAFVETPYNLASDGVNAFLLMKDINTNALLFGDMDSGWTFTPAIPTGSIAVFFNSDLVRYGTQWVSPLRNATNDLFILAKDTTTPWTIEQLSDEDVGSGARMDAQGPRAGIVYTAFGRWWFAYNESGEAGWKISELRVPGCHLSGRPDIAFLDNSPYLVFADSDSGEIKAAKGTPPGL